MLMIYIFSLEIAFLKLESIFKYLNATPESRCVVKEEVLLSAKLLVLCNVTQEVNKKQFAIAGLCMQSSIPHKISGVMESLKKPK